VLPEKFQSAGIENTESASTQGYGPDDRQARLH
jgi:hypothetical protein